LQYRLSPAEAQLCFLIRDGHSLSEAAAQMSTSYNAVRARLKRVFEKTGIQRQADLVRLLLYRSALELHREHSSNRASKSRCNFNKSQKV
jgi:DNA-binding CsgD family transcriptional regulator